MDLSVSIALDLYFKEHISIKAVARKRFEYAQDALVRHIGETLLCDIDIPACREYAEERRAEGVGDSTIRRELGTLQAAVNHAVKWRRLSLADKPSIELTEESAARPIWLFKEELALFLETAAIHDRRVFRFLQLAYHTGSRKRAVETLPWGRVDLESRRIDLQDPDTVLTKKRRPIVPISEKMAEELRGMKSKAITPFVLVNDDDIRPAFNRVASVANLTMLEKSGLREAGRLTPHVLRHSRATHLLQENKSPWAVANLLGDSLQTVLKVYGHTCSDYLREIVL